MAKSGVTARTRVAQRRHVRAPSESSCHETLRRPFPKAGARPSRELVDAQEHYLQVFRQPVLDSRLPDKLLVTLLGSQPLEEGDQIWGPPAWQRELRAKLEAHHGKGSVPRAPIFAIGPIGSSDRLIKDPRVLLPWIS